MFCLYRQFCSDLFSRLALSRENRKKKLARKIIKIKMDYGAQFLLQAGVIVKTKMHLECMFSQW